MRKVLSVFVVLFSSLISFAQPADAYFELSGFVVEKGQKMDEVQMNVYQGNEKIYSETLSKKGKFYITLPINSNYIMEFSKDGYVTKRVAVNTDVKKLDDVYEAQSFAFDVTMYKEVEGVDLYEMDFPSVALEFSSSQASLTPNKTYTKNISKRQSQVITSIEEISKNAK